MFSPILTRLKSLVLRARTDAELDEEIRYHVQREIERNIANGMRPDLARDAAHRVFGNVTVAAEHARDTMRWRALEELRQDARYALRTFTRAPTFVFTVVTTIGLGLGLLTAAFTLFEAYVLRPTAVRDPYSLYDVSWHARSGKLQRLDWTQYRALVTRRDAVSESFAYVNLVTRLSGQPAVGQLVTGNYFAMLGVSAMLGRPLLPEDSDVPRAGAVIVISYDTWQSMFGSDSSIIGRPVILDGVTLRVVGVARPGFGGLEAAPFQFWAPISMIGAIDPARDLFSAASSEPVRTIVRVRPNVTAERAAEAILALLRVGSPEEPVEKQPLEVLLQSRATSIALTKEAIEAFTPLALAFLLVMLIACANVANVMLARGMARQREIGIRLSLGAGRRRLIRQLLTESVVLALPAALAGYVVSRATIAFGLYMMVARAPLAYRPYLRPLPLTTDTRILTFLMLAAILAAIAFGLAPALQATRPSVVHATRGDFDSNLRPSKMRNALVISQVALSALLLICASVLLGAARETRTRDPGSRTQNLVHMSVTDRARPLVIEELRRLPDARRLASAATAPFDGILPGIRALGTDSSSAPIRYNIVSPEYFAAIDIPVRQGRVFTEDEARARASVVMVNEAAASLLWPNRDPLGQHVVLQAQEGPLARYPNAMVIGVVRNARPGWIALPSETPTVYYPQPVDAAGATLIVRTASQSDVGVATIERAIAKRDSTAIREAHSVEASFALQLYPFDMAYWTAALVGGTALLLTLTGVYGVLAYVVAQRTREFGVRLALGASPSSLVVMMVRQLGRLAAVGLLAGGLLALVTARVFASISNVLDVYDVKGFALGGGVVIVSCLLAAYVPARGAGRVDPVEALRAD
jgi:predicted permease